MTDDIRKCPDWPRLIARREVSGAAESAQWQEALEHRRECSRCRQASIEADPLMMFAGLPTADVADREIADMQARVAELRRVDATGRGRTWMRLSHFPVWLRTAAAATALAATVGMVQLGLLSGSWTRPRPESQTVQSLGVNAAREDAVVAGTKHEDSPPDLPDDLALLPLIEDLDLRDARVYQMTGGGLDLVMIVDGSLDI